MKWLVLFLISVQLGTAQQRNEIDLVVQQIDEAVDGSNFTSTSFQTEKTETRVKGHFVDENLRLISVSYLTADKKTGRDFYFLKDELVFISESIYKESTPVRWEQFKTDDLSQGESRRKEAEKEIQVRYYFQGGVITYPKNVNMEKYKQLMSECDQLRSLLQ